MENRNSSVRKASLFLFFISPVTAELLSGSTPPLQFFNPFVFTILVAFYGCGAIIMRELKVQWGKNYASLLILGMAYGIIEEGLAVKSFFDPNWVDLGILGVYGRWIGINWVWCVDLTLFHSVISIVIPIALTELMYPNIRNTSLVSKRTLKVLCGIFVADMAVLAIFLTDYYPPIGYYIATIIIVFFLMYIAYKFPDKRFFNGDKMPPSPRKLWGIGLSWIFLNWVIFFNLPYFGIHPVITIMIGIGLFVMLCYYLSGFNWKNDTYKLSVISGVLTFLIVIAILQEIVGVGPDNPAGMSIVGLAYTAFLFYLKRKISINQQKIKSHTE